MQEEKQKKLYRDELENITRELVEFEDKITGIDIKLNKTNVVKQNALFKELCKEKAILMTKIESHKNRRNHLINLLNVVS